MSLQELPLIAAAFFMGCMGNATIGFGENLTFQILWHFFSLLGLTSGELTDSAMILTLAGIPSLIILTALNWSGANLRLAALCAVLVAISAYFGVKVLWHFSENPWLKRILGFILLFVFLWMTVIEARIKRQFGDAPQSSGPFNPFWPLRNLCLASCCALLSGILAGAFAVPGPPFMVFVLLAHIPGEEWRGTYSLLNVPQNAARMLGLLTAPGGWAKAGSLLPAICAGIVGGALGVFVGNHLKAKVSMQLFRTSLLLLLLAGSASMISAGTGDRAPWVVAVVLCIGLPILTWLLRSKRAATAATNARSTELESQILQDG
eukprot:TRINITY_DN47745_c0_g1_i1.p1 TRINITY_DN47745_c0_g1~~TRINITY_DN47745_c0_g1_i1.p1  ORF type:complete len:320 (-),score=53.26 TRINITY_DN47745_c0_g1_i1:8-967(-)